MNGIVDKKMSVNRLYSFIETSEVSDKLIILLILLMGDKEVLKIKAWNVLSRSFFKKYQERILAFCGYGKNKNGIRKITVDKKYRNLFLDCIGCMMRQGIITACTYSEMAKNIDAVFDVGYTKNTVLNKLKEENPDFEELENLIYSEKKRIKSSCENKN